MRPGQIKKQVQLLVEGKDALNFFAAFTKHLKLTGIQIQDFGGVNDLGDFLQAFSAAPGFREVESIGIVRDAEKLDATSTAETRGAEQTAPLRPNAKPAAEAAFQSVCTSLGNAHLPVPRSAIEKAVSRPVVSVLILPSSTEEGMLETLLCRTFEDTREGRCVSEFLKCVGTPPESRRYDKARAHAYLATKPKPHVSVGVAAQKNYWDFGHGAFADTRSFLMALMPSAEHEA